MIRSEGLLVPEKCAHCRQPPPASPAHSARACGSTSVLGCLFFCFVCLFFYHTVQLSGIFVP